ncbi:hypothetical protein [Nocardia sp. NPDC057353]|uniref:hypothetical protein n=1 Tax=Nocardia sp. NPDC057353 TaxID=3346104 RepID=UPI00363E8A90
MSEPRRSRNWIGRPTFTAMTIALTAYLTLSLLPYLVILWLFVLVPLQLLTGLALLARPGTKRQAGVGLLLALLTAITATLTWFLLAPTNNH